MTVPIAFEPGQTIQQPNLGKMYSPINNKSFLDLAVQPEPIE
jgi:hypothetical protein